MLVGLDENDTDFDTIGKEGGSKTHMLTKKELANHGHVVPLRSLEVQSAPGSNTWTTYYHDNGDISTNFEGNGQAFSIQNMYRVVGYMWIRTA